MLKVALIGNCSIIDDFLNHWNNCTLGKLEFDISKICCLEDNYSSLADDYRVSKNVDEIFNDIQIDVVIELIIDAEEAFNICKRALEKGKYLISTNKYLLLNKGSILENISKINEQKYYYSNILGIARHLIFYEPKLSNEWKIIAVLDDISNLILRNVKKYRISFQEAVNALLQEKFDKLDIDKALNGEHTIEKLALCILAKEKKQINLNSIYRTKLENIDYDDFDFAEDMGYVIKYVAFYESKDNYNRAWIGASLLPAQMPIAKSNYYSLIYTEKEYVDVCLIEKIMRNENMHLICHDLNNIARKRNTCLGLSGAFIDVKDENKFLSSQYFRIIMLENPHSVTDIVSIFIEANLMIKDLVIKRAKLKNHINIFIISYPMNELDSNRILKLLKHKDLVKEAWKFKILDFVK